MGEDDIVELLWKSSHVIQSSQAQEQPVPLPVLRGSGSGSGDGEENVPLPIPLPLPPQLPPLQHHDQNLFIREDEMASWLHHHPPLPQEDEFHSHLFYPFTQPQGSISLTPSLPPPPPPPPPQDSSVIMYTPTPSERAMGQVIAPGRVENFINFSRLRENIYTGGRAEAAAAAALWVVTDSTQVGSNATPSSSAPESYLTPATVTGGVAQTFAVPRAIETVCEMAGPSSSGVSRTETAPFQIQPATEETEAGADERKRKEREEQADDTKETGEEARGSTSRKRSRAAEMHNISEKKRREKINEKMKALQELIPRCNKTDKASMLDDAIEYVKALQMQIQMMSRGGGGGMMPMMHTPNMQRFMPPSAMGTMGMNRPPFIPFLGTDFPRQAHMAGLSPPYPGPPRYPFAFDPSRVHLPTQQPDSQPQFPGYLNPYSQFVGLQHMQQPPPPLLLQNQTTSLLSFSHASTSKEPEDHQDNKPIG